MGWNQMACQAPRYVATNYKEGSLGTQPASNPPTFQSLFPPTVPPDHYSSLSGISEGPLQSPSTCTGEPLPAPQICMSGIFPSAQASLGSFPEHSRAGAPSPLRFAIPACNHLLLLGSHTPGDSEGSPGECSRASGGGSPTFEGCSHPSTLPLRATVGPQEGLGAESAKVQVLRG